MQGDEDVNQMFIMNQYRKRKNTGRGDSPDFRAEAFPASPGSNLFQEN